MLEDSSIEVAEARLRKFWADALRKAGGSETLAPGAKRLAERLQELGILGNKGQPYNAKSIEAWPAGRRLPSAEVMVAVAIDLGMSLDHYVHGRAVEQPEADLARDIEELKLGQDFLLSWMLQDEAFAEAYRGEVRKREERRSAQVGA